MASKYSRWRLLMQAYVFHLMQAYVLQIFCRPPLLKKCMAIEKFKMLPFTRLQAFEGPLFLQNSVTNKNLRCSIHICNRTVLCSWNPTWNICTFHNTLICSYTWPAVHNFVQQSHLLSSRPATVCTNLCPSPVSRTPSCGLRWVVWPHMQPAW